MMVATFFMSPSLRMEVKRSAAFRILVLRNACNPLHDLRRVARILLAEKLKDTARMLKREIVGHIFRKGGGAGVFC